MEQEIRWLLEEKHKGLPAGRQGKKTSAFLRDLKRLKNGEHLDYIIGFVEFLGCKIDLRYKPLIPRPETEYWTEKAIEDIRAASFLGALPHISPAGSTWAPTRLQKSRSTHITCLDIFAGSGCIGIAVLKHVPGARVDFAEKEKKFCKQITLNAKLNKIAKSRYRVIQSDIFSKIKGRACPERAERVEGYDYIFANPPYLAEARRGKVQKSVLAQEPHSALFAGKDGLKYIRQFLSRTKDFLKKDGIIYLEFDSFQKSAIEKLLKKFGYSSWLFHKDQYKKWRFVVIKN